MTKKYRWATLLILFGGAPLFAAGPTEMAVQVPVADVRSKTVPHNGSYEYDPLQETQVLLGEHVLVYEKRNGWARIECPEQPEFTHHNKWEGYPGWVQASALSSDLARYPSMQPLALTPTVLRKRIVEAAERHIGSPYLWGGRSLHDRASTDTVTGVDCSGLVSWSFRQTGRIVPRDAHEQFMKAKRIQPAKMKPGDLIFSAKPDKPDTIVHVAIYAGDGELIEAPQSGEKVRRIKVEDKLGAPLESLSNGRRVKESVVYFGNLLEADQ
jgi:hypothetical protein